MSDSVRPHRQQPTRLPRPWDSPGKNTGVSCHFLLQCMKVKSQSEVAQSCPTLSDPMDYSLTGSSAHGIFQARVLEWGSITFSGSQRWRSSLYSQQKQDQELTVAKIMNPLLPNSDLKKVGKTTRPFTYDLNQIPYDYTV